MKWTFLLFTESVDQWIKSLNNKLKKLTQTITETKLIKCIQVIW